MATHRLVKSEHFLPCRELGSRLRIPAAVDYFQIDPHGTFRTVVVNACYESWLLMDEPFASVDALTREHLYGENMGDAQKDDRVRHA